MMRSDFSPNKKRINWKIGKKLLIYGLQQIVSFLSFIREETEKNAFRSLGKDGSGWVMYAVRPHRPEACGVRACLQRILLKDTTDLN